MARIRTLDFLPEVFQTPTNAQFLAATLDQVVAQPAVNKIQGYVGSKLGYGVNANDYYVTEPTKIRTDYQLDPGVVFKKPNESVATDFISYPGIIDAIKIEDGPTVDNNRLFTSQIYSWDSFTSLDKTINFNQYYWIPQGPASVTVAADVVYQVANYLITDVVNGYNITPLDSDGFPIGAGSTNATITLLRGGTYTFAVSQDSPFWIQGEPGVSGYSQTQTNMYVRDVLGVSNNGASAGLVTFQVPSADAQDQYDLPGNNLVDLVSTIPFDQLNGKTVSQLLTGVDGVTSLEGRSILFYNTGVPSEMGFISSFYDITNYDTNTDVLVAPLTITVTDTTTAGNVITCNDTSQLLIDNSVTFTGFSFGGLNGYTGGIPTQVGAGAFTIGQGYAIAIVGTTDWIALGLASHADVTADIVGTTMTVTAINSGQLAVGDTLTGTGVTPGTTIVDYDLAASYTTGNPTYIVSVSQTVASTTILGYPVIVGAMLTVNNVGTGTGAAIPYFPNIYYVTSILSATEFTVSDTIGGADVTLFTDAGSLVGHINQGLFEEGYYTTVDDYFYTVTYTGDPLDPTIQLIPLSLIPTEEKITASYGSQWIARQFFKNSGGDIEIIPFLSAPLNTLYYQDGVSENKVGIIRIIDSNTSNEIDINDILGKTTYTSPNGVVFTNGLKVSFAGAIVPVSYATGDYYVEGVGTSIELLLVTDLVVPEDFTSSIYIPWDTTGWDIGNWDADSYIPVTPDYITIARNSMDRNAWSRSNRWFHIDVINATAEYNNNPDLVTLYTTHKAKRPIIEFYPNLKLFNQGTEGKSPVDFMDTRTVDAFEECAGKETFYPDVAVYTTAPSTATIASTNFSASRTITASSSVTDSFTVDTTTGFNINDTIVLGTPSMGGLVSGTIYFVHEVVSPTEFKVAAIKNGPLLELTTAAGSTTATWVPQSTTVTIPGSSVIGTVEVGQYIADSFNTLPTNTIILSITGIDTLTLVVSWDEAAGSYFPAEVDSTLTFTITDTPLDNYALFDGARIVFSADENPAVKNKIYVARFTTVTPAPVVAGNFILGTSYKILSVGTTDFTAAGSTLVTAGVFVVGRQYAINVVGTTNFMLIGATSNTPGVIFTATGVGTGTGTANETEFTAIDPGNGTGTAEPPDVTVVTLTVAEDGDILTDQQINILRGYVSQGDSYYFDGSEWIKSQTKITVNQPPLFDIFDADGISFSDSSIYIGTSFAGCKLFAYGIGSGADDSVLGFPLRYSSIDNLGDISFDVSLNKDTFDYVSTQEPVTQQVNTGYVYRLTSRVDHTRAIGWLPAVSPSIQYQVFKFNFVADAPVYTFECDVAMYDTGTTEWPTIQVLINNTVQSPSSYTVTVSSTKTTVVLDTSIDVDTVIQILVYSNQISKVAYYSIPLNLSNNPLNDDLTVLNVGDLRGQYQSIFYNNPSMTGTVFGSNNYRDLGAVAHWGNRIIQNSASLALPGAFLRKSNHNVINALLFNSREYVKFKSLLVETVNNAAYDQRFNAGIMLDDALDQITAAKSSEQPFFWSDMLPSKAAYITNTYTFANAMDTTIYPLSRIYDFTSANYYSVLIYLVRTVDGTVVTSQLISSRDYTVSDSIPSVTVTYDVEDGDQIVIKEYNQTYGSYVPNTPTKLGMYPASIPAVILDSDYAEPTYFIRGHDGSFNKLYGSYDPNTGILVDFRDQVLLEFETRVYNNLKLSSEIPIDALEIVPGFFRSTDYSYDEWIDVYGPNFLNWVGQNRIDYKRQSYNTNNQFTYNYFQSGNKIDKQPISQGYWRGIYLYYYDTSTPNLTPWEMLGIADQPSWWTARYGAAPYTSENLVLWEDLAQGIVWNDGDPYVNPNAVRAELMQVLPVDSFGDLVSPLISIVGNYNNNIFQRDWKVGDMAPAEFSYRRSSTYPFDLMKAMALMKPAKFFNLAVDLDNYKYNEEFDQYLVNDRSHIKLTDIAVYGSGTAKTSYINWIIDYEKQAGISATAEIESLLASVDVRLVYRLAGFSDKTLLKFYVEKGSPSSKNASLLIPDESYSVLLYDNQPFNKIEYSGIVVQIVNNGYSVYGNNQTHAYFKTLAPRNDGNRDRITVENLTVNVAKNYFDKVAVVPYSTIYYTPQEVAQFITGYGAYMRLQGMVFDQLENELEVNWAQMVAEFLYWAQTGWEEGSILTLNPAAKVIKIDKESNIVQPLTLAQSNFVLNQNLYPIQNTNLAIVRDGTLFSATALNDGDTIAYGQFNVSNFEHGIVFDNTTLFNDVIYNLITGLRQTRIAVRGVKSAEWNGTVDIQGFIYNQDNVNEWTSGQKYTKGEIVLFKNKYWVALGIVQAAETFNERLWKQTDYDEIQKGLLPNSSTRSYESTLYYDINNTNLENDADLLGFSLIGYRPRDYLALVDLTDITQVNVYQNMIKNKGTLNAAKAFKGATFPQGGINYEIYDNWAIKSASFGGVLNNNFIQLNLNEALLTSNPTIVSLTDGISNEGTQQEISLYNIFNYGRPINDVDVLAQISVNEPTLLYPDAGYANFNDVKMSSYFYSQLPVATNESGTVIPLSDFYVRDYVWLANFLGQWNIFSPNSIGGVISAVNNLNNTVTIRFASQHGLAQYQPFAVTSFNDYLDGYYTVANVVDPFSVIVNLVLDPQIRNMTGNGVAMKFQSQRVSTASSIASLPLLNAEFRKNTVWVDTYIDGNWAVLRKSINYALTEEFEGTDPTTYGSAVASGPDLGYLIGDADAGEVYRYTKDYPGAQYYLAQTIAGGVSFGSTIARVGDVVAIAETTGGSLSVNLYKLIHTLAENALVEYQAAITDPGGVTTWGSAMDFSGDQKWLYISDIDNNKVHLYRRSDELIASGYFVVGNRYTIVSIGTTDFTSIGAPENTVGIEFVATGVGTGTGTATDITYSACTVIDGEALGLADTGDNFGISIATDHYGDTVIIGAPNRDYDVDTVDYGYSYVFSRASQTFEVQYTSSPLIPQQFQLVWTPPSISNEISGTTVSVITAGSFVVSNYYTIVSVGTTDFTLIGASSNTVGIGFIATGAGTGTGTASTDIITCASTSGFAVNDRILFSGVGYAGSNLQLGVVYFVYSVDSGTTFRVKTALTSTTPLVLGNSGPDAGMFANVQSTPIYVYVNGTVVDSQNYAIVGSQLLYCSPLQAGDILTVSGQLLTHFQTMQSTGTPQVGVQFGTSVDTTSRASEILVGAPFKLTTQIQEGAVYRYTNAGAKYGMIIGTSDAELTAITRKVLINGYAVYIPVGDAVIAANAINNPGVTNVVATASDGKLILSLVDPSLANVNEKLLLTVLDAPITAGSLVNGNEYIISFIGTTDFTLLGAASNTVGLKFTASGAGPGTGTADIPAYVTLEELGFPVYTHTQTILCPHASGPTQFGTVVKFNEHDSFVVSAPTGTRYEATTFDFTDDEDQDDDTIFDNNTTQWIDSVPNAGAAYMFDYLGNYEETLANVGNFVYAQSVNDTISDFGSQPMFGTALDFNNSTVIIGTPGYVNGRVIVYDNESGVSDWAVHRSSSKVVDINKVSNVQLYSKETNETLINLDYIDPLQGKILGAARENIDVVSNTDPAIYNNRTTIPKGKVWAAGQLGQIWFDTTNVRFVNYHQNSNTYNSKYWGTVFPGSDVAVYTWVSSLTPPVSYQGPGIPYSTVQYSGQTVINSVGEITLVYFFWARNTNIISTKIGKTLSDAIIASYIQSPKNSGISYFAPLLPNVYGLYNTGAYLNANDSILQLSFATGDNDDVEHSQYSLIRANYADDFLPGIPTTPTGKPESLYDRLLDSLSGVDEVGAIVPNPYLPKPVQTGISVRPRQSFFVNRFGALKNYLQYANTVIAQFPITETKQYTFLFIEGAENPSTGLPFYHTTDYWEYINWWAPGYDDNTKPTLQVARYADLSTLSVASGTIVSVTTTGSGNVETYIYADSVWSRIGLTNGTIQFKSTLWDYSITHLGFGDNFFDTTPFDQYPSEETRNIVRALTEQIFTQDLLIFRNKSLILLFEYVQSEAIESQNYLPWLNKTSFIDVAHTIRELLPIEVFQTDNQEFLSGYINEVKPYHVVIRDFLFKYTGSDVFEGDVTDFDVPAKYNSSVDKFVVPQLVTDGADGIYTFTASDPIWEEPEYTEWFQNRGVILAEQLGQTITILASYMARNTDEIAVDNAQGFPINGVMMIGTELIGYASVDRALNVISGLTRGVNNTEIVEHLPGDPIIMDLPAVIVLDAGRGYVEPPVVEAYIDLDVYPEPIRPAVLAAVMNLDQILRIDVVDPGQGYMTLPSINIAPATVITFNSTAVNVLSNTIQMFAPTLQTGDLVQYRNTSGTKVGGLISGNWYYVNVLETVPKVVIGLYTSYDNAVYHTSDRVVLYSAGTETHTLSQGARASAITSASPLRENNIQLRFDRTSYNSDIIEWENGMYYGAYYAGNYNNSDSVASSSIQLQSTRPDIDTILASAQGASFEIVSARNDRVVTYSSLERSVLSTTTGTNAITLTPLDDGSSNPNASGSTIGFYVGMPVKFAGAASGTNLVDGTVYYVESIIDLVNFTVSATDGGAPFALNSVTIPGSGLACLAGEVVDTAILAIRYPGISTVTNTSAVNNALTIPVSPVNTGGTHGFYIDLPMFFTGTMIGGIIVNQVYYVNTIIDDQTFTISETQDPAVFECTDTTGASDLITVDDSNVLSLNEPVIFNNMVISDVAVTDFGNIISGQVYYVAAIPDAQHIQISTEINGVPVDLITATGTMQMTSQVDVVQLSTASGTGMVANINLPISPGQINGQRFDIYASSAEFSGIPLTISSGLIERTITSLISATTANTAPFEIDVEYVIVSVGTTDFTLIGAATNTIGEVFTATGAGTGTGTARRSDSYRITFTEDSGGLTNLYVNLPITIENASGALLPATTYYVTDLGTTEIEITSTSSSGNLITCNSTDSLYIHMPIFLTGVAGFGTLEVQTTYFVRRILSATTFTVSATYNGGTKVLTNGSGAITGTGDPFITIATTSGGTTIPPGNTQQAAAITIAGPAVVTVLLAPANGARVEFKTTGALPTGIIEDFMYYVQNRTGTTFEISTTPGGLPITTTGTQSGAHTVIANETNVFNQEITVPAEVSVSYLLGGYNILRTTLGEGYAVGNSMLVLGATLDGTTPANNLTITVVSVGVDGEVTNVTASGTPAGGATHYYLKVISDTEVELYSDPLMRVPVTGIDLPFKGYTTTTVTGTTITSNEITVSDTSEFEIGDPVMFSGAVAGGLVEHVWYYVYNIVNATTLVVSEVPNDAGSIPTLSTTTVQDFTMAKTGSYLLLPEPFYFNQSVVKFNHRLYRCLISNHDTEFIFGKWELLFSDDRSLNELDRIVGYYDPTVDMPGADPTQLLTGVTYPNGTYSGNPFAPAHQFPVDTDLSSTAFDDSGDTFYIIQGSEFAFGYGPEELIPGIVSDDVSMIVATRPGTDWDATKYAAVGYNVVSTEYTPESGTQVNYSFDRVVSTPASVVVYLINGTTNLCTTMFEPDYAVNWITNTVVLENALTGLDRLRIDVYEVGNGNQLVKADTKTDPIRQNATTGWSEIVVNCNYTDYIYNGSGVIRPNTEPKETIATASESVYNTIQCDSVLDFVLNEPITFQGTTFGGILEDTVYWVKTISYVDSLITISDSYNGMTGQAGPTLNLTDDTGSMYVIIQVGSGQIWTAPIVHHNGTKLVNGTTGTVTRTSAIDNTVTCNTTGALSPGMPITFSNTMFGGILVPQTTYYVLAITDGNQFTIEDPGSPGNELALTTATGGALYVTDDYAFGFAPNGVSAKIVFSTVYDANLDFLTYTLFGETLTTQYGYTLPETELFEGDGAQDTFTLSNYASGDNPDNAIVEINGLRMTNIVDYTINPMLDEIAFATPPALNAIVGVTTFNLTDRQYLNTTYGITGNEVIQISTLSNAYTAPLRVVNVSATDAGTEYITCVTTSSFIVGQPAIFRGTGFGGIATDGTVYFVRAIISGSQFTIEDEYGVIINLSTASGLMQATIGGTPTVRITTTTPHGFAENELIRIDGTLGSVQLNNSIYYAKYIKENVFDIYTEPYDPALGGVNYPVECYAYISGGVAWKNGYLTLVDMAVVGTDYDSLLSPELGSTVIVADTSSLEIDTPLIFTSPGTNIGDVLVGGIIAGTTYFVRNIVNTTKFVITETQGSGYFELFTDTLPATNVTQWEQTNVDRLWITLNGYRIPSSLIKINPANAISLLVPLALSDELIVTSMMPSATPSEEVFRLNVNKNGEASVYRANTQTRTWLVEDFVDTDAVIAVRDVTRITDTTTQNEITPAVVDSKHSIGLMGNGSLISFVAVYNNTTALDIDSDNFSVQIRALVPTLEIDPGAWITAGDSLTITIVYGNTIYIGGEQIKFSGVDFNANVLTGLQRGANGTGELPMHAQYSEVFGSLLANRLADVDYAAIWTTENQYAVAVDSEQPQDPLQTSTTTAAIFLRGDVN